MRRNILIAIVAVSVLAPLALVPTGASAGTYTPPRSIIPTFHPSTIQQPRPSYTPPRPIISPHRPHTIHYPRP